MYYGPDCFKDGSNGFTSTGNIGEAWMKRHRETDVPMSYTLAPFFESCYMLCEDLEDNAMRVSNCHGKNASYKTSISVAEKEMLARRSARLAVCITVCAVLGGLAILLAFIHYFCVPHMLTASFYLSTCHVTEITSPSTSHSHLTLSKVNQSALDTHCTRISVSFTDYTGTAVEAAEVYQSSWSYYQVLYGPQKCLCQDCEVIGSDVAGSPIAQVEGTSLLVGDEIPCYYNVFKTSDVLLQRRSTALVLNAMLWPTLVFICGFVGLFFACLFAQGDNREHQCYIASYFSTC